MTKELKSWLKEAKAWVKTQENGVESCDLAINHARQNIALNERAIRFESEQRLLKINALKGYKKFIAKTIKGK